MIDSKINFCQVNRDLKNYMKLYGHKIRSTYLESQSYDYHSTVLFFLLLLKIIELQYV